MRIGRHFWFFLAAIVGAVANRIRGGWLGISGGDWIFGGVYGLFVGLLGVNWLVALLAGLLMTVAGMPKWGVILGAIGGYKGNWFEGTYKAPSWIMLLTKPLQMGKQCHAQLRRWGVAAGLLRGCYYILPMSLIYWPLGLLAPFGFVAMYWLGISIDQMRGRQGWEIGELLFGAFIFTTTYVSIAL